jgi:hypothetical protein
LEGENTTNLSGFLKDQQGFQKLRNKKQEDDTMSKAYQDLKSQGKDDEIQKLIDIDKQADDKRKRYKK